MPSEGRSSIAAVNVITLVCAVFWGQYVAMVLVRQTFHTELSAAVPGGLAFDAVGGGPFVYLMTGFIIKALSLAVSIYALWRILTRIAKGKMNSPAVARLCNVAAFSILAWLSGAFFELMGNNFAANRIGIESDWTEASLTSTSVMIIAWLLIGVLFVLERAIVSSQELEAEVDGLV
ncbi:MAG: hypothetical protein SOW59_03430 [Corynebacterium sp.]|nr:hypothetical protein [Corynebacterium sp.]